jgi:hypothetical protein
VPCEEREVVRKALKQFAEFQEEILKEHDEGKGGREEWCKEDTSLLFVKLIGEMSELANALAYNGNRVYFRKAVSRECADMANFAMMIYDNVNRETNK